MAQNDTWGVRPVPLGGLLYRAQGCGFDLGAPPLVAVVIEGKLISFSETISSQLQKKGNKTYLLNYVALKRTHANDLTCYTKLREFGLPWMSKTCSVSMGSDIPEKQCWEQSLIGGNSHRRANQGTEGAFLA